MLTVLETVLTEEVAEVLFEREQIRGICEQFIKERAHGMLKGIVWTFRVDLFPDFTISRQYQYK